MTESCQLCLQKSLYEIVGRFSVIHLSLNYALVFITIMEMENVNRDFFYLKVFQLKDTIKAFNDFKNKQKSV